MSWIIPGVIILILVFILSGLFFWSSGALNIADEEKKDIEKGSPEGITKEVLEQEKEAAEALEAEQDEFHSARG